MGAIGGVELLLRVALINSAVSKMAADGDTSEERRKVELKKIQSRTLGPTVAVFKADYPEFGENAAFCESIENAIYCRNQLAHHFVENNLHAFTSEEGVELATLGCIEHMEHFQSLEQYIRDNCPIDFDAFFNLDAGRSAEFVKNHPLRDKLQAIKDGRLARADMSELGSLDE